MSLINVLVFSGYYLPGYKGGGPIKTIKNLFDQVGQDISFKLITSDHDLGDTTPYNSVKRGDWNTVGNAKVFYTQKGATGYKQLTKVMKQKDYDLIYLNSFFSIRFSIFPQIVAKLLKKKIILGPRGEFSIGALNLKPIKKQLFIKLYKLLGLHHGTVFQASSPYEADDIRRILGPTVDIFTAEDIGSQEFAKYLPPRSMNKIQGVFISRISPKKNLLTALNILKSVKEPVLFHIFGPIEDHEYWANCEAVIKGLPEHVHVEYKGELTPDQVVSTISEYDFFFMPTLGENFGHVIAEALCAGLPLLIANTTPWRNLQQEGIGWDLPLNNLNAFSNTIDQLALMPVELHMHMRKTVLAWAKNKFSQQNAIKANIDMFRYAYEKK